MKNMESLRKSLNKRQTTLRRIATHPTPYPDINAVLHVLLSDVQTVLGNQFVGMYLYGSLASGDFAPQRSDIDFVVVTDGKLADETLPALAAMHARIAASGLKWAAKLEGSYIPQHVLRRHDPTAAPCPYINEGNFRVGRLGGDWIIQRHTLREQGIVLAGPAPHTLIDPVQPDDLRWGVLGFLREWWAPMLHNPDPRLRGSEYQAYTVLTLCRALYTLECGDVVSKPVAARWAQEAIDEQWRPLIEQALAWPDEAQPDHLSETLDFIRYALERSQPFEVPTDEAE
jgi:hypothetical protein